MGGISDKKCESACGVKTQKKKEHEKHKKKAMKKSAMFCKNLHRSKYFVSSYF
jgi:hypothetical protein